MRDFIRLMNCILVIALAFIIIASPIEANAAKKCIYINSRQEECTLDAKKGSDYCKIHGCKVAGCTKAQTTTSFYCKDHVCSRDKCYSNVVNGSKYCAKHTCEKGENGCYNEVAKGGCTKCHDCLNKVNITANDIRSWGKGSTKTSSSLTKKKNDPYNASSYKSGTAFADAHYEDFFDYEDDYDDEDEAWDDAYDYWVSHH